MDIKNLQIGDFVKVNSDLYAIKNIQDNILVLKNLLTNDVAEKVIVDEDNIEVVETVKKQMQYSYEDGKLYYFIDMETYEQVPLTDELIGDCMKYLKEDSIINMTFVGDKLIEVTVDPVVELLVTSIVKQKDTSMLVELETNMLLEVPKFVKIGDIIEVDTKRSAFIKVVE